MWHFSGKWGVWRDDRASPSRPPHPSVRYTEHLCAPEWEGRGPSLSFGPGDRPCSQASQWEWRVLACLIAELLILLSVFSFLKISELLWECSFLTALLLCCNIFTRAFIVKTGEKNFCQFWKQATNIVTCFCFRWLFVVLMSPALTLRVEASLLC